MTMRKGYERYTFRACKDTIAALADGTLDGKLCYVNKADAQLVGFQGNNIIVSRKGHKFAYDENGDVIDPFELIDSKYRHIRVYAYFRNDTEAKMHELSRHLLFRSRENRKDKKEKQQSQLKNEIKRRLQELLTMIEKL